MAEAPVAAGARAHANGAPVRHPAALWSVAGYLPERVVGNDEVERHAGVDDAWIVRRTGVRERRYAAEGERLSDMAAAAGAAALERAGVRGAELDLVLVGTTTQDEITPSTAPYVAHALGAPQAGAFDVGAACTGWVSAVATAAAFVEAGRARRVLAVGTDQFSRFIDPTDRRTSMFGDGAGASVLGPAADGRGRIGPVILRADAGGAQAIIAPRTDNVLHMEGHDTFSGAVARMVEVTGQALDAAGLGLEEIDVFAYHQANARITRAVGERLGLPADKVLDVIGHMGNTSAASIPLALAEAEADGRLQPGHKVLLAAFGAGFTWGGTVVEWDPERAR
jgi:3-oxoacyl-[acyl-carrier-protein] synthase-3